MRYFKILFCGLIIHLCGLTTAQSFSQPGVIYGIPQGYGFENYPVGSVIQFGGYSYQIRTSGLNGTMVLHTSNIPPPPPPPPPPPITYYSVPAQFVSMPAGSIVNYGGINYQIVQQGVTMIMYSGGSSGGSSILPPPDPPWFQWYKDFIAKNGRPATIWESPRFESLDDINMLTARGLVTIF